MPVAQVSKKKDPLYFGSTRWVWKTGGFWGTGAWISRVQSHGGFNVTLWVKPDPAKRRHFSYGRGKEQVGYCSTAVAFAKNDADLRNAISNCLRSWQGKLLKTIADVHRSVEIIELFDR